MVQVTFKDFRDLAERKKWDIGYLTDLFTRKIDDPREFFERVLSCSAYNSKTQRREDRSGVVIPYRSVLELYFQTLRSEMDKAVPLRGQRTCPCGCGLAVIGRKKYASEGCRKRAERQR